MSRELKDSGVEWIGKIPANWSVEKIKYTTYVKGRIGWQGLKSDEFTDEGPYLVTGKDFIGKNVNWESCHHISRERYHEAPPIQLKENDLLITKDGTIGKTAIVRDMPDKAILNSGIFVTRSAKYEVDFMYWMLNSQVFDKYIKFFETGSTIKHLYQETFENFSYPLPTRLEQKKISLFLNRKIKLVDEVIKNKGNMMTLLEKQCQSIITEAVTKGLNPNVKMKDSGVEWIGEIPEHWEVSKFKYLGKLVNGYPFPSNEFSSSGVRVMKINNIQNMRLDWNDESFIDESYFIKLKEFRIQKNDLVFALTRPIISTGIKAAIVDIDEPILLNQRNAYFRSGKKICSSWLYYLMLNKNFVQEFESLIDRTGQQPNISSIDIENIKLPIPPVLEQEVIINHLNHEGFKVEKTVTNLKNQIKKLKEYRQSLIYEAVTGKIDVRDMELY
ncbi:restriction endonuclease subunit S [Bacillus velezensis]|uniref:restriction endonuclease subunit S n=2 Tax=Bacillaceae TaxID=186817 RepID=UPI000BA3BE6F|nr:MULTISPECIES: restriction endonuclease subunit S [Bacillus]ATY27386.1 restriction endonuclease subunit S [Bacillus velezensis]MBY0034685.1 restriction endonuclease subunit S [Bacillus velezensis]MBY0044095.1 restriction endonuclease subunit S [Bacillus velezensis]MCY9463197.1 restriction endonuclease subunit S [Bacillus velezensis]PAB03417.1 restriction endonuclease subunit S [Bacillus velezensis]